MSGCQVVKTREGYIVNTCTGEVIDFEGYDVVDYSNLEYYERTREQVRKTREDRAKIRNLKKVVMNYLLSIMDEREKEEFFRFLNEVERHGRVDSAMYIAIFEFIREKEGKPVSRDYLEFLKAKGIGAHSVRQRKKLLRATLNEDPVINYIDNEYEGDKDEARLVYCLLKRYGLMDGKARRRKEILLEHLRDEEKKKKLLVRFYEDWYIMHRKEEIFPGDPVRIPLLYIS